MQRRARRIFTALILVSIALSATIASGQSPYYVLDGLGGVHAGGGAPILSPGTPYFGFDVAKDIVFVPGSGAGGYLVLDAFGGVHPGGSGTAAAPATPYFGFDIARAITSRASIAQMIGGGSWVSFSDVRYAPMFGVSSIYDEIVNGGVPYYEERAQTPMPAAGTLTQFRAHLEQSPGVPRSVTFRVRKNGVDTTVSCTASNSDHDCTDPANVVSFAAGDLISISATPTNAPSTSSFRWTAVYVQ